MLLRQQFPRDNCALEKSRLQISLWVEPQGGLAFLPTLTACCKQITSNMTDLAKVAVACCPISLACLPQELRHGAPFSNKISLLITIQPGTVFSIQLKQGFELGSSQFTTYKDSKSNANSGEVQTATGSMDWHVRGTRIDKHLCLPLLLILHCLYYSGPWVCEGNGNLIKMLPESMKTMQFIAVPWAQLPKESVPPLPWQGSARSPRCSVAAGKDHTALPGRQKRMQRKKKTSASYVQVFVLQC